MNDRPTESVTPAEPQLRQPAERGFEQPARVEPIAAATITRPDPGSPSTPESDPRDAAESVARQRRAGAARGYGLVPSRALTVSAPVAHFGLGPGDRILVAAGEDVMPGLRLAERQRDVHVGEGPPVAEPEDGRPALRPGDWWPGDGRETRGPLRRRQPRSAAGEILHRSGSRWRIASGEHLDPLDVPAAGTVVQVVPGSGVSVALRGLGLPGVFAAGSPSRGRLERIRGEAGLRGALDVGRAGAVLLVDGRTDSEAIIRARAMGVRGIVVAGLAGKDLRDLLGSEARQRASLQPLAPFAVLVLDGTLRRPIPGPVRRLLGTLEGSEVAIVVDPPMLIFDTPAAALPMPETRWVRVRGGALSGQEGRWVQSVGVRRFATGVHLEAALVELDGGQGAIVPIADLERFV